MGRGRQRPHWAGPPLEMRTPGLLLLAGCFGCKGYLQTHLLHGLTLNTTAYSRPGRIPAHIALQSTCDLCPSFSYLTFRLQISMSPSIPSRGGKTDSRSPSCSPSFAPPSTAQLRPYPIRGAVLAGDGDPRSVVDWFAWADSIGGCSHIRPKVYS